MTHQVLIGIIAVLFTLLLVALATAGERRTQYNSRAQQGSVARCGDGSSEFVENFGYACRGRGGVVTWRRR